MDIRAVLVAVLVLAPFGGALLCVLLGAQRALRSAIVLATGAVLILSAVALAPAVPFRLAADSLFGLNLHRVVQAADALLLLIVLYYGLKHKRLLIVGLAIAQLALVSWLEFFMVKGPMPTERILCDHLSHHGADHLHRGLHHLLPGDPLHAQPRGPPPPREVPPARSSSLS